MHLVFNYDKTRNNVEKLVQLCVSAGFNDSQIAEDLRVILKEELDWSEVIKYLMYHRLLHVFYRLIINYGLQSNIPPDILSSLKQSQINNAIRAIKRESVIKYVLRALRKEEVPVIMMKGAYLDEIVYEAKNIRPYSDIDLLVKKKDLAKASLILNNLGFIHLKEGFKYKVKEIIPKLYREEFPTRVFLSPKPVQAQIGLHTNLGSSKRFKWSTSIDIDQAWSNVDELHIFGEPLLLMKPDFAFLYLCLHFSIQHELKGPLIWIRDLVEIIRYYDGEIDWDHIKKMAEEWNIETQLWMSVYLLEKIKKEKFLSKKIPKLKPEYMSLLIFEALLKDINFVRPYCWKSQLRIRLLTIAGDKTQYRIAAFIRFPLDELLRFLKRRRSFQSIKYFFLYRFVVRNKT